MRNIGDYIYRAGVGSTERWETCPDCNGDRHLTVILGTGEQVTIPCADCAAGYEPPRGEVKIYDRSPRVERLRIDGLEVYPDRTTYKCNISGADGAYSYSTVKESEAFDNEDEAMAAAVQKAAEEAEYERTHKRENHRSWAWHVTYHRGEIKRAQATIERSTALLDYANTKAKR